MFHFSAVVVKKKKRKGKGKHKDWGPSRTGKEKRTPGSGVMFPCSGSDLPGAIKPLVDIVDLYCPPRHPHPRHPQRSESSSHPAKTGFRSEITTDGQTSAGMFLSKGKSEQEREGGGADVYLAFWSGGGGVTDH